MPNQYFKKECNKCGNIEIHNTKKMCCKCYNKQSYYKYHEERKERNRLKYYKYAGKFNWTYTQKVITAKRKGHEVKFTREQFQKWFDKNPKICEYCGRDEKVWNTTKKGFIKQKRLTIDRKDNNRTYEIDNICWACPECNTLKKTRSYEEFKRDKHRRAVN